jgi:hypothetical protein
VKKEEKKQLEVEKRNEATQQSEEKRRKEEARKKRRKEKKKGGYPWRGPSGSRRWRCWCFLAFWSCGDGLELYRGRPDSDGECAAQDGKNGRGQPSSFLVLSQIFTQSYRRVKREYSFPGDSML